MKSKTILVPGDQSAEVVVKGEAEIGVAQTSEIIPVVGAQLVGPLPGDLNLAAIRSSVAPWNGAPRREGDRSPSRLGAG